MSRTTNNRRKKRNRRGFNRILDEPYYFMHPIIFNSYAQGWGQLSGHDEQLLRKALEDGDDEVIVGMPPNHNQPLHRDDHVSNHQQPS